MASRSSGTKSPSTKARPNASAKASSKMRNPDEDMPRRHHGQNESWSEDIDEDIESPRSTPRHASLESSNPKSNKGRGLKADQIQNWSDVTDEDNEFDESDEDMLASGSNEEDEEDYDEEEDHRTTARRPSSHN
ncbi:hypothetical protein D3C87_1292820 [compost metagenome]